MYQQESIKVGKIEVPIIIENEIIYYPISYITEKILLRNSVFLTKKQENDYEDCIKKFKIQFSESNIQLTKCISEECLKDRLSNTQVGRLSKKQRKSQNQLHKHLKIHLLSERKFLIREMTEKLLNEHDQVTKDIIIETMDIKQEGDMRYVLCSNCDRYYPLTPKFFAIDNRNKSHGYSKICRVCHGSVDKFSFEDKEKNYLYRQGGEKLIVAYKNNSVEGIFKAYIDGKIKRIPDCYKNKEDYLRMIKYLVDKKIIDPYTLSKSQLSKFIPTDFYKYLKIHDVYVHLFGDDYYFYPWRYENFKFKQIELTYEIANKVFDNYLKEKGIVINDPFAFDYYKIIKKTSMTNLANRDLLFFIVQYNNFKYGGYLFKTRGENYYKNHNNLLFDLKYLIEKDMKLEISKIPLYLTKAMLRNKAQPLYNYIVQKGNGNIYEWVNKLYPDKFTEYDFDINFYSNEFDSIDEAQIHDILINNLKNVIYNTRNDKINITVDGIQPDWIVIGREKCWFIEYFGMWSERYAYNKRTSDYIKKAKEKIKKYDAMKGYGKIYLYPEDLEENFKGVIEKVKEIK